MTRITIEVSDAVAAKIKEEADLVGRDVPAVAASVVVDRYEDAPPAAYLRDQQMIETEMAIIDERLNDGQIGRPADEVFSELLGPSRGPAVG